MKEIELLKELIKTPSVSREEDITARIISSYLEDVGIKYDKLENNLICLPQKWSKEKPILVLNSHHDTVKPVSSWVSDPFEASENEEGKITGLGSNDAGGALVGLLSTFEEFYKLENPYNLVFIASAEEEISGDDGIRKVLRAIDFIPDLAIVGEPTEMQLCIAEKGLLVIDGYAKGVSSHAARASSKNAIYGAMKDIINIENFVFEKRSEVLDGCLVSVTQVNAGTQHNVIPDACHFVIDARVNEKYTLMEVFEMLQSICSSELKARSFKNNPSSISVTHPLVKRAVTLGRNTFGSPTLSDQAHFSCPSVKIGPGRSERSHTAEEFIYRNEIKEGIKIYKNLIRDLSFEKSRK